MRLTWLPDVLRASGLTVDTYPDWAARGSASWGPLRGVICHATAGSRTSTDAGETRVLWVTGSPSAPAPISQLYLSRTGRWIVGASGRCNHVLTGHKGPHKGYGNGSLIGIEAANDNRGEPWPAVQLDSYQRGVAAICRHMGWSASVAVAHREHQDGKTDPHGVDMGAFRRRVAELIEEDDMTPEELLNTKFRSPTLGVEWTVADWLKKGEDARREVVAVRAELAELRAAIEALTGPVNVAELLAAVKAEIRDAVADLGEGGAAHVRADA